MQPTRNVFSPVGMSIKNLRKGRRAFGKASADRRDKLFEANEGKNCSSHAELYIPGRVYTHLCRQYLV